MSCGEPEKKNRNFVVGSIWQYFAGLWNLVTDRTFIDVLMGPSVLHGSFNQKQT